MFIANGETATRTSKRRKIMTAEKNKYIVKTYGAYKAKAVNKPTERESAFSNVITIYSLQHHICVLEDLFPYPEEQGILSLLNMSRLSDFFTEIGLAESYIHDMDMDHIFNRSGTKFISRLVENLIMRNDVNESGYYPITFEMLQRIANIIALRFGAKWQKLYKTVTADFDAIAPFVIEIDERIENNLSSYRSNEGSNENNENEQRDITKSGTKSTTQKTTDERSSNDTRSESGESDSDGSNDNTFHGFNGSTPQNLVPRENDTMTSKDSYTSELTDATAEHGTRDFKDDTTDSETETGTVTHGSTGKQSSSETYKRDNPITRKTTRKGNIGNITMQELTAQQREMLQWQFWDVVFEDCDSVLTRGQYRVD